MRKAVSGQSNFSILLFVAYSYSEPTERNESLFKLWIHNETLYIYKEDAINTFVVDEIDFGKLLKTSVRWVAMNDGVNRIKFLDETHRIP